jgi:hypothetical protein
VLLRTRQERFSYTAPGLHGRVLLGLLVIQLFFWLFPPGLEGTQDDLILWYIVSLYDSFGRVVLKQTVYKAQRRSWLLIVNGHVDGKWRELPLTHSHVSHLTHPSHLSGKVAWLPRRILGAGLISLASCISTNLLVPDFPRDNQMQKYAFFVLA